MKLDMLFFLGIFYTMFGLLLVGSWLILGGTWNLYGTFMLAIGIALIIIRPRPPLRFFLGRPAVDFSAAQDAQCWCGRLMKAGRVCNHGEGGEQAAP